MSTNPSKYPPSHRWADDGPVFAGVLVGLRWAKGKPEYGGGMIPVITVEKDGVKKSLWLSGAVLREVTAAAPRYGDTITITRATEPQSFMKDGQARQWYPVEVDVVRVPASAVDLADSNLPDARDDDIPF